MRLKIIILVSLIAICGAADALEFVQEISVAGNGGLSARTNTDVAKDQVNGSGEQNYTKILKLEDGRSNLVSNYDLKNGSANRSSYYYVEMRNQIGGLTHSFQVYANSEIKSECSIQQNEETVSTIYGVRSSGNATLAESVTRIDPDRKKSPETIIETNISGNFSINSKLSDKVPKPPGDSVESLLAKLNAVDLSGDTPVEEDRTQQPPVIIIRGKEAPLSDSEDYHQDRKLELMSDAYDLDLAGNFSESLKIYDEILGIDPEYEIAWNNKGFALFNLGRYYEAIGCYDKALGINPDYADARNNKGFVLLTLNRSDEALKCYESAIALNPQNAVYWNGKGVALFKLGRYQEAINSFDEALLIDPGYADAASNRDAVLGKLGNNTAVLGNGGNMTNNDLMADQTGSNLTSLPMIFQGS